MADQSSHWPRSQKVILLTGLSLVCSLQLVLGKEKLSLSLQPRVPKAGQNVTLSVQGLQGPVVQCHWSRHVRGGKSGVILRYSQQQQQSLAQGTSDQAYTGRETLQQNCSLRIARLSQVDAGNYTLNIRTTPVTGQGTGQQSGQSDTVHDLHVYLEVSALDQTSTTIDIRPPFPREGQDITLTPQRTREEIVSCKWFIRLSSTSQQWIIPSEQSQQGTPEEFYINDDDCSLKITKSKRSHSGNYTVLVEVIRDRQQETGKETDAQWPEEGQTWEYRGEIFLEVLPQQTGGKDPQISISASSSLSCTTGVIAGALFGSLTVADALGSLIYALFSFCASWKSRFFP